MPNATDNKGKKASLKEKLDFSKIFYVIKSFFHPLKGLAVKKAKIVPKPKESLGDLELLEAEREGTNHQASSEELKAADKRLSKKTLGIIIGIVVIIIIISILIALIINKKESQSQAKALDNLAARQAQIAAQTEIKETALPDIPMLSSINAPIVDDNNLQDLIKKADILYKSGNKDDALDIYKQIASFSKAIANYNLGVVEAKSKDYLASLRYYDLAINSGEDIPLSANNAMADAYYLKDEAKFKHYLNISNTYLNQISTLVPYPYIYALNQYYNGNYFEALSPLSHPSSAFSNGEKRLASKMYAVFNDNLNAYKNLKEVATPEDELALGQLAAREGNLKEALAHIENYLISYPNDINAQMSAELISLRMGAYANAAKFMGSYSSIAKNVPNPYPIKVVISPNIFDVNLAQRELWRSTFENSKLFIAKILFYYAPYRVFDVDRALRVIVEGVLDTQINQNRLEESNSILVKGATISEINQDIALALKRINNNDTRGALKLLERSLKSNIDHAVLHYDIGVLYAQMGEFDKAYYHFLRAYHLDNNDILAGNLALLSGVITKHDNIQLNASISESIRNSKLDSKKLSLYKSMQNWINDPRVRPYIAPKNASLFEYAYSLVSATSQQNKQVMLEATTGLKDLQPNDLVANYLYGIASNFGQNAKNMSLNLQYLFKGNLKLDLNPVFYGPTLAREIYIKIGFITGNLKLQKKILQDKLSTQDLNPNGIMQALAYLDIYDNNFEESYSLYNTLINDRKEDDSNTRFFGALAAIGAGHNNIATLLLQLAKMDSSSNFESKYALGLLYQEQGNYNAAAQHFNSISNTDLNSEYFSFKIDDSKIKIPQ
ncbi:tetratricopeptide repeat protein [Helicobacter sp. 11S02629-2]|uniref:tetratricopeptide repeat protein n=1 Tax=Helicobacter sp. 11S02629-2 TaxID=1476195 RepID=UPI000BA50BC4|nr:tetratricopeptide repeat protein [Helicobacter sp. 11S02629-2]PAF45959.1 hypothetical protein BKH40_00680 [Helicobacter sp. 11S02629-2]